MLNGYFKTDKGILGINQGTGTRVFPVKSAHIHLPKLLVITCIMYKELTNRKSVEMLNYNSAMSHTLKTLQS